MRIFDCRTSGNESGKSNEIKNKDKRQTKKDILRGAPAEFFIYLPTCLSLAQLRM